jgi:hypothetical protein
MGMLFESQVVLLLAAILVPWCPQQPYAKGGSRLDGSIHVRTLLLLI